MMRIVSVTAVSFGALRDKTLHLGEGLNVVFGFNGSGKSTWHAALYAAICGPPPDTAFAEADQILAHYRPAHGPWVIKAVIELEAGRKVDIHRDLLRPDATTVRQLISAPPAALAATEPTLADADADVLRWLGLDRRSYAATAWVRQGHPLMLSDQEHHDELQRAVAANIGADDVAAACDRIARARDRYVGADGGPLRQAQTEVDRANRDIARAGIHQNHYLRAVQELDVAQADAQRTVHELRLAEAAEAMEEAARLRTDAAGLRSRLHPTLIADLPAIGAVDDSVDDSVGGSVDRIGGRTNGAGGAAMDIDATVNAAEHQLREVEQRLRVEEERLHELEQYAREAKRPIPEHHVPEHDSPQQPPASVPAAPPDLVGVPYGVPDTAPYAEPVAAPKADEAPVVAAAIPTWQTHFDAMGYPGTTVHPSTTVQPGTTAALAWDVEPGGTAADIPALPESGRPTLLDRLTAALRRLRIRWRRPASLVPAPQPQTVTGTFPSPADTAVRPAADQSTIDLPAPSKSTVDQSTAVWSTIDDAVADQTMVVEDLQNRLDAARRSLALALARNGSVGELDNVEATLHAYRLERAAAAERDREERQRLEDELQRLEDELRRLEDAWLVAEERANRLSHGLDRYDILYRAHEHPDWLREARDGATLEVERAEAKVAAAVSDMAGCPTLDAANAAHEAAVRHAERLRALDRVLRTTADRLAQARTAALDRIAEGMRALLTDYLPEVTEDARLTVSVDRDLRVLVGESGRDADDPAFGSHSTAELAYVLRRQALARYLAGDRPLGPLLLDDVTSSADGPRVHRLLNLLYRIAQHRQVVVFAHEDAAWRWADRYRTGDPRLHLHVLGGGIEATPVTVDKTPVDGPGIPAVHFATPDIAC